MHIIQMFDFVIVKFNDAFALFYALVMQSFPNSRPNVSQQEES